MSFSSMYLVVFYTWKWFHKFCLHVRYGYLLRAKWYYSNHFCWTHRCHRYKGKHHPKCLTLVSTRYWYWLRVLVIMANQTINLPSETTPSCDNCEQVFSNGWSIHRKGCVCWRSWSSASMNGVEWVMDRYWNHDCWTNDNGWSIVWFQLPWAICSHLSLLSTSFSSMHSWLIHLLVAAFTDWWSCIRGDGAED